MYITKKMKIEIYYMNTKITTEINKNIQVKDLINELKKYLNTTDSNYVLLDSEQKQLNELATITHDKNKKSLTFYLIKPTVKKNALKNSDKKEKSKEDPKISQYIMKCTGAKKALNIKNNMSSNQQRAGILELLEHRNNHEGQENNAFDRLLNLLQLLEEFDHPGNRDDQERANPL